MYRAKLLLIIIFIFLSNLVFSQKVIVSGNALTYAGDELSITTYSDQITFTEKTITKSIVDKDGNFTFEFTINKPIITFIKLKVFKGFLYVEPNNSYKIVLPQKVEKSQKDKLNPFFKETEFYVRLISGDKNNLNFGIKKFDYFIDMYTNKYFKKFAGKVNKSKIDTAINFINKKTNDINSSFFNDYKHYNYESLKYVAYNRNQNNILKTCFSNKKILYNNPAYMDMFNQIFKNFFSIYYKTKSGKQIAYNIVKQKSLFNLKQSIKKHEAINNDSLCELIILKSIFDSFANKSFPENDLIVLLDSISVMSNIEEHKIIANNIKQKYSKLMLGYSAIDFLLPNKKGKLKGLRDFKGSFIYLNFCTTKSYSCINDFVLMNRLYKAKIKNFKIVTILVEDNIETMKHFVDKNNYNWIFLYSDINNNLLKEYNVKAYPSYFMISPDGKVNMLPAFSPAEPSFEARLNKAYVSWKREMQRNRYLKNNGLRNE